jgi:hypothetical protein
MNAVKLLDYLYTTIPNVDLHNPPFSICIQGDDSMVLLDRKFSVYIKSEDIMLHSSKLGFKVKFVNIAYSLRDVDYCSRLFWPTHNHPFGYVLAPKIGKVLGKIGYSRKEVPDVYQHNRGIALGLLTAVSNVPFLKEWCDNILRITENVTAEAIIKKYVIQSSEYHNYTPETWEFLYEKYGLTQSDLLTFQTYLQRVDVLPYKTSFPGDLQAIIDLDLQ